MCILAPVTIIGGILGGVFVSSIILVALVETIVIVIVVKVSNYKYTHRPEMIAPMDSPQDPQAATTHSYYYNY